MGSARPHLRSLAHSASAVEPSTARGPRRGQRRDGHRARDRLACPDRGRVLVVSRLAGQRPQGDGGAVADARPIRRELRLDLYEGPAREPARPGVQLVRDAGGHPEHARSRFGRARASGRGRPRHAGARDPVDIGHSGIARRHAHQPVREPRRRVLDAGRVRSRDHEHRWISGSHLWGRVPDVFGASRVRRRVRDVGHRASRGSRERPLEPRLAGISRRPARRPAHGRVVRSAAGKHARAGRPAPLGRRAPRAGRRLRRPPGQAVLRHRAGRGNGVADRAQGPRGATLHVPQRRRQVARLARARRPRGRGARDHHPDHAPSAPPRTPHPAQHASWPDWPPSTR